VISILKFTLYKTFKWICARGTVEKDGYMDRKLEVYEVYVEKGSKASNILQSYRSNPSAAVMTSG
jgi:hypothetical protein